MYPADHNWVSAGPVHRLPTGTVSNPLFLSSPSKVNLKIWKPQHYHWWCGFYYWQEGHRWLVSHNKGSGAQCSSASCHPSWGLIVGKRQTNATNVILHYTSKVLVANALTVAIPVHLILVANTLGHWHLNTPNFVNPETYLLQQRFCQMPNCPQFQNYRPSQLTRKPFTFSTKDSMLCC